MDLQIIKIASDNKNQKTLKKYTHEIKNKNSICGDEITIKLLIIFCVNFHSPRLKIGLQMN